MFQASDVLSLFEPADLPGGDPRFIYEIVWKPARMGAGDPSRSQAVLKSLEEAQDNLGFFLEGLIHWRGGLLVRVRLSHSLGLDKFVLALRERALSGGWDEEPESVRLIHPEKAEEPANAFTHQMDRIRRSMDDGTFPTVGLFYFHRELGRRVAPAA